MLNVLVVDDEEVIRSTVAEAIQTLGHSAEVCASGEEALLRMHRGSIDLLLTDLAMDGMNGIELLGNVRERFPQAITVIMTAQGTISSAVTAIRNGAFDYLSKPFDLSSLELLLTRVDKLNQLQIENSKLRAHAESILLPPLISTRSARLLKTLDVAGRVAMTDATLLITGQSGTGKTMLARLIHERSLRGKAPFGVVNCATLSENLLESELFGHVRGSFTGAVKDKVGRLQAAEGGTVFLDEIGEISPALQTKLLRFLQDREFERVGDTRTVKVNVRIIAATNKNLEREVDLGHFRQDLYFRLNVIELRMPSLRERREDIVTLAERLLTQSFATIGKSTRPFSEQALRAISSYGWPGNIRELKNALERAAILCTTESILLEDLPDRVQAETEELPGIHPPVPESLSPVTLDELERQHIENVLSHTQTLEEAASILGINLSTLWRKRRTYGMGLELGEWGTGAPA